MIIHARVLILAAALAVALRDMNSPPDCCRASDPGDDVSGHS